MLVKTGPPFVILVIACFAAFAQHGTAPSGYYPLGYSGDTWTGEVVSTDAATREITISYMQKSKLETFTGVLMDNYQFKAKDGSLKELKPSDIPKGARVTLFCRARTKRVGGQKVKYFEIFKLEPVGTP